MDKKDRVAFVCSTIWLMLLGFSTSGTSRAGDDFLYFGMLPVAAYWSYRFINKRDAPKDS